MNPLIFNEDRFKIMKVIRNADQVRIGCLGNQKILINKNYRQLVYTTFVQADEGYLLYNNLTDELLFLTHQEKEILDRFDLSTEVCKNLIEKWYYVPDDHVDYKLADQLDSFLSVFYATRTDNSIDSYTIFPTTDCNARCFYCYEKGIKKIHMSDNVASDTADFIIKRSNGKEVKLHWFGGEPLYNSRAIDIICEKLKEANVVFKSSMISNGYLFDDDCILKAKELWNLQKVQITLDGTEEIYNKIKAFIYNDGSAFKRVISNIEKLLKADIFVTIRMNMDSHNYENLFELVTFLCDKFGDYKNLRMYSQTLFDESSQKHMERTDDERDFVFEKNKIINSYIKKFNNSKRRSLDGYLKKCQCMADNDNATTINPLGGLGKCEHFPEKYLWGSIYSEEINAENINIFKKRVPLVGKCYTCPVRPGCLQLENCPNGRKCNETLQKGHFANVKNRIITTYNLWKSEQ